MKKTTAKRTTRQLRRAFARNMQRNYMREFHLWTCEYLPSMDHREWARLVKWKKQWTPVPAERARRGRKAKSASVAPKT